MADFSRPPKRWQNPTGPAFYCRIKRSVGGWTSPEGGKSWKSASSSMAGFPWWPSFLAECEGLTSVGFFFNIAPHSFDEDRSYEISDRILECDLGSRPRGKKRARGR